MSKLIYIKLFRKIYRVSQRWKQETGAEKNTVVQKFTSLGLRIQTAFESQALIQLYNTYCGFKHCYSCAVGNLVLLKKKDDWTIFLFISSNSAPAG